MPKYPFSPEILDALPEELAELFRGLEIQLLEEICSRLKLADNLNEVTVQDIRALRSHGIDLEDIRKAVAETSQVGEGRLNELLEDVVQRNEGYYAELADLAKATAPERLVGPEDARAIQAQTLGEYRNLTQSMGFLLRRGGQRVLLSPAKAYQWALDQAELQIHSGAISYQQAITEAVRQLAESGLKTVSYESGHVDSLDVAVRRAVMTGVNQLNQRYREQSMDALGTDLVEVTAHIGARDTDGPNGWENHKKWQGKVYRWRKSGGGYAEPERQTAPKPVPEPPAPIQTATSAPTQPAPAPRSYSTPLDVTQEYLDAATPNSHIVQDLQSYTVDGVTYAVDGHNVQLSYSQHERKIAALLERTLGGEIFMVPRVNNPQGVRTPDYLFRGKAYDLKTLKPNSGPNTIFNRVKKAEGQAQRFIIDVTHSGLDDAAIDQQLEKLFTRSDTGWLEEIFIIRNDAISKIVKRA